MKLRIAIVIAVLAAPALAGDKQAKPKSYQLRNELGERTGTLTPRGRDGYELRDNLGRRQGTLKREGYSGDWVIRDTLGQRQGRVERKR